MISAWPPGPLHLLPFPNPEGSLRTPPTFSLCVCLRSRGYSTGAHTESLDSQGEARTASPPGPPVLLWPHTENSTLGLPHAPQSLFADLLPLHSSTPGSDLSQLLPLPLHYQLPPSLSPELWAQKGKSNKPPYAQNVSLTPCHNKGYFG